MDKLVSYAGYDHAGPHIFPIEPDRERTVGFIKMARPLPPRVEHYIRTARPIPGKTQLLLDPVGASEYWGCNVNGDDFPEAALRHDGDDYGFRTFEKFAYPFKHHINKDPARAYGDRVTLAEYDPVMHRILLVVSVRDELCRDILGDLSNGKYWDISIGCRVPWDECSICRNRARSRAEYCPHLRYQMRKILGDGRRVCAINRLPKFFDISFVVIGAEKAAHVLKKIASGAVSPGELRGSAEDGERLYGKTATQTKASANKRADLIKQVPSNLPPVPSVEPLGIDEKTRLSSFVQAAGAAKAREPALPPEVLARLAAFPLAALGSTLTALGVPLKPEEFQRIILIKIGQAALAEKLAQRRIVFDEHEMVRELPAWAQPLERFVPDDVNEKIALVVAPYLRERSCYPEPLLDRLDRLEKRAASEARDRMIYNREWYAGGADGSDEAKSALPGFVPAGLALAAGLLLLKKQFPQMMEKGPLALVMKHPWILPLLVAGGVGASVGLHDLLAHQRSIEPGSVDGMEGHSYARSKTAGMNVPWMRLGLIPLAYIYAGIARRRAERGEPLGSIDQFIASRPDVAAISSFALAPTVERGVRGLLKRGTDLQAQFNRVPADSAIYYATLRLARHLQGETHAHAR